MIINNKYNSTTNTKSFGELKFKNFSHWNRCAKKVFGEDKKGYIKYTKLLERVKKRQANNQAYDIWLTLGHANQKDSFEAAVIDRSLDLTHHRLSSEDASYKSINAPKMLMRLILDIESLCPKKPLKGIYPLRK